MSHGIWTDEEWTFIRGFNASAQPAIDGLQDLRREENTHHRRIRRAYLFVGILLGWGASAVAYAVASRYADQCFEVNVPTYSAPAVARPVLPGT